MQCWRKWSPFCDLLIDCTQCKSCRSINNKHALITIPRAGIINIKQASSTLLMISGWVQRFSTWLKPSNPHYASINLALLWASNKLSISLWEVIYVNPVQLHTMESSESVASVTGNVVKSADYSSSDCMGSVGWEAAKSLLSKLQILSWRWCTFGPT